MVILKVSSPIFVSIVQNIDFHPISIPKLYRFIFTNKGMKKSPNFLSKVEQVSMQLIEVDAQRCIIQQSMELKKLLMYWLKTGRLSMLSPI